MLATGTLKPTPASTDRSYTFVAASDPTQLHDGAFTVYEKTGVVVRRTVRRTYLIQEQPPVGIHRVFLVVKDDDRGRDDLAAGISGVCRVGDVYECRVPVFPGTLATCTCKAGQVKHVQCLHSEVLCELVTTGNAQAVVVTKHGYFFRDPGQLELLNE